MDEFNRFESMMLTDEFGRSADKSRASEWNDIRWFDGIAVADGQFDAGDFGDVPEEG